MIYVLLFKYRTWKLALWHVIIWSPGSFHILIRYSNNTSKKDFTSCSCFPTNPSFYSPQCQSIYKTSIVPFSNSRLYFNFFYLSLSPENTSFDPSFLGQWYLHFCYNFYIVFLVKVLLIWIAAQFSVLCVFSNKFREIISSLGSWFE